MTLNLIPETWGHIFRNFCNALNRRKTSKIYLIRVEAAGKASPIFFDTNGKDTEQSEEPHD